MLENYLKYRIEPLLERQIRSEAIFGGQKLTQMHSLTNLGNLDTDKSNEDRIMVERYPVSTMYLDET
jgi:hypothetical protein